MKVKYELFYQYGSYQIIKTTGNCTFSEVYVSNIVSLDEALKIMDSLDSYKYIYGLKILEIEKEEQDV